MGEKLPSRRKDRRQAQEAGHSIPDQLEDKTRPETRETQAQQGGHSIPGKADTLRKHGEPQQQTAWGERQATSWGARLETRERQDQGGGHSISDQMGDKLGDKKTRPRRKNTRRLFVRYSSSNYSKTIRFCVAPAFSRSVWWCFGGGQTSDFPPTCIASSDSKGLRSNFPVKTLRPIGRWPFKG